jgi:hypothetical protein
MGGCPAMHTTPNEVRPKTKKAKKDDDHQEVMEDTAIRRMKYEEFATPTAEKPVHPDHYDWLPATPQVDTMEFRRSDAKPGEFNPKPF